MLLPWPAEVRLGAETAGEEVGRRQDAATVDDNAGELVAVCALVMVQSWL